MASVSASAEPAEARPSLAPDAMTLSGASDWLALLKPRVVVLVVFTGAVGLLVAPGHINFVLGLAAVLAIAAGAGAAGAINMWFDSDIDAIMRRTSGRPIPRGVIAAPDALAFGVLLATSSVILMFLATNAAAALLLAVSIAFYVFVYTAWLKRRTPQNIVIGGAAGAFPPAIGWLAVTGTLGWFPVLMFLIVFLWTPPHFWALSLYAHSDYEKAGVPMLPVVAGPRTTRWNVLAYAVALAAVSLLPWAFGYSGNLYAVAAAGLGGMFVILAVTVVTDAQSADGRSLSNDRPARNTFKFSLLYLFALFSVLLADHVIL